MSNYSLKEYNEDCKTIDKLSLILSTEDSLVKNADIASTIKGVATSIYQNVKSQVDEKGLYVILDYLSTGFLLRFGVTGMIIYGLLEVLGINLSDVAKSVIDAITKKGSGIFTREDAFNIAQAATQEKVGTASLEYFHDLRKNGELNQIKTLVKEAGWFSSPKETPWYESGDKKTIWEGISNFFKGDAAKGLKTKKAGGGMLRWLITTILLGFVGKQISDLIKQYLSGSGSTGSSSSGTDASSGSNPGSGSSTNPQTPEQTRPAQTFNFPIRTSKLKHSNVGLQYFINDSETQWFIVVLNGNIANTLIQWAVAIYPELKGHEDLIRASSSFNKLVSILGRNYTGTKYLQIPPGNLHTWTDIVNIFVPEIEAKITEEGK